MTDGNDARAMLSEMIEITEQTIAPTRSRYPDLDALYRECPTAFWLAPDGDDVLPPAPFVAAPSQVAAPIEIDEDEPTPEPTPEPTIVTGMSTGVWRALLVAGPTFAATGIMAMPGGQDRWWDPFGRALVSLVASPLTVPIGAMLGLVPILAGVLALGWSGREISDLRHPAVWGGTGAMMGLAIAALFDAGGGVAIALVATSMLCALIARTGVAWSEPDFA